MLKNVVTDGTGAAAQLDDRSVAGKTGTTDEARDLWFIGYIPQLVAGVWLGNDNNTPTYGSSGTAAYAWRRFMRKAVEGMPVEKFPPLPKLESRKGSIKAEPVKPKRLVYIPIANDNQKSDEDNSNNSDSSTRRRRRRNYDQSVDSSESTPRRRRRRNYDQSVDSSESTPRRRRRRNYNQSTDSSENTPRRRRRDYQEESRTYSSPSRRRNRKESNSDTSQSSRSQESSGEKSNSSRSSSSENNSSEGTSRASWRERLKPKSSPE
jgi:penicillin-binding protein 1A